MRTNPSGLLIAITPAQISAITQQGDQWLYTAQQDTDLVARLIHASYAVAYYQSLLLAGVALPANYQAAVNLQRATQSRVGARPTAMQSNQLMQFFTAPYRFNFLPQLSGRQYYRWNGRMYSR